MKTKPLITAAALATITLPAWPYLVVSATKNDIGKKCYSEDSGVYARKVIACAPGDLFFNTYWDYPCPEYLEDLGANDCILENKDGITYVCMPNVDEDPCIACPDINTDSQYIQNWTSIGNNRVYKGRKDNYILTKTDSYTCTATEAATQPNLEYGCAAGYYTTATTPSATMTCQRCPASGGTYGTSAVGNTSIIGCYIPSGTAFSDTSGSGTYSGNCYYSK